MRGGLGGCHLTPLLLQLCCAFGQSLCRAPAQGSSPPPKPSALLFNANRMSSGCSDTKSKIKNAGGCRNAALGWGKSKQRAQALGHHGASVTSAHGTAARREHSFTRQAQHPAKWKSEGCKRGCRCMEPTPGFCTASGWGHLRAQLPLRIPIPGGVLSPRPHPHSHKGMISQHHMKS